MARKRDPRGDYWMAHGTGDAAGKFIVHGPDGPVSKPVKQGLALDIARVFNSGAVMPPVLVPQEHDVVVKVMGTDDDHYRLIDRDKLYTIATRKGVFKSVQDRDKGLWTLSRPTEVGGSDAVDYEVVTGDKESWDDLRAQLVEEDTELMVG